MIIKSSQESPLLYVYRELSLLKPTLYNA